MTGEGGAKASAARGGGGRRRLAWAWLAAVIATALLGRGFGIGPFAWAETWWAVKTGSLLGANLLIAMTIAALPALWVLLGAADKAEQAAATDPAGARRHVARIAAFLLVPAGLAFAAAAIAFVMLIRLPDGSETVLELEAAMLAGTLPQDRRAIATGAPIERARAAFMQGGRGTATRWTYIGVRPGATRETTEAEEPDAPPVALFVERREGTGWPPGRSLHPPPQERYDGYLVRDGLPPHARIVLEQARVRIASPHYLLRDAEAERDGYRVTILLGLIFGAMLGLVALLVLVVGLLPIRPR